MRYVCASNINIVVVEFYTRQHFPIKQAKMQTLSISGCITFEILEAIKNIVNDDKDQSLFIRIELSLKENLVSCYNHDFTMLECQL